MTEWIMNNLTTIVGSGAGLALLRLGVAPYVKKFNKMHEMLLPNNGSSAFDGIKRTETKVNHISDSLQMISAEHRAVMYLASEPIFKTDALGRCIFVNRAYQDMVGLPAIDCLGEGWARAIHPDDAERVYSMWMQSIKSETEFNMESYKMLHQKSGKVSICSCRATITRDEDKKVLGSVGVVIIKAQI